MFNCNKPLLNADLVSLDQMSEDQLAKVPFKMPKAGAFDLQNPILSLPKEDEEQVSRSPINRSQSQNINDRSGTQQSCSSSELKNVV